MTPYRDGELYPTGPYVNNSSRDEGLAKWLESDARLDGQADPVVWHVFGLTHLVRPEDYPIMVSDNPTLIIAMAWIARTPAFICLLKALCSRIFSMSQHQGSDWLHESL